MQLSPILRADGAIKTKIFFCFSLRQRDRHAEADDADTDHGIAVVTAESNDVNRRRVIGYADATSPRTVLPTRHTLQTVYPQTQSQFTVSLNYTSLHGVAR